MFDGLSLVIDKSTLQSLSSDESFWLGMFFHVILTPTLFMEIRADLLKASQSGRKPEQEVAILADKISGGSATISPDYHFLCLHNLMQDSVEMRGRPILLGGQEFVAEDGRKGLFFDEQPPIKSLRKWRDGIFTDEDWEHAQAWRDDLSKIDLDWVKKELAWTRAHTKNIKTDADVLAMVDQSLGTHSQSFETLNNMMGLLRISTVMHARIIEKWERAGRPMVGIYAPYATYVARIEMFFYSALARGLLDTNKPSDRVDLTYLYYLPFAKVFASSDNFHKRLTPLFLSGGRTFIEGDDLKADLVAIRDFHETLPEDKKSMNLPPLEGDFLVSRLYDQYRPGWRERAKERPIEITPERNEKIMERLRPMMEAIDDLKKGKT